MTFLPSDAKKKKKKVGSLSLNCWTIFPHSILQKNKPLPVLVNDPCNYMTSNSACWVTIFYMKYILVHYSIHEETEKLNK